MDYLTPSNIHKAKSAGKALLVWILFYVFLAHCFVIWKWSTPNLDSVGSKDIQAAIATLQGAIDSTRRAKDKIAEDLSEMGRLYRKRKELETVMEEAENDKHTQQQTLSAIRVKQLLNVPDLSMLRSTTAVSKVFESAIAELEKHQQASTHNNNSIQPLIDALFATTVDRQPVQTCPKPSDLVLSDEGLPLTDPSQIQSLQVALREAVLEAQSSSDTSNAPAHADCLGSSDWRDIDKWMEAGLDALERKQDLRRALLSTAHVHVILDMDLDDDDNNNRSKQNAPNLTLRDLLDRRPLYEASSYIDKLLEFVGGQYEVVDAFLDQHVFVHIPDDQHVGHTLLRKLLEWSEKVGPLPPAARVWR